MLIFPDKAGFSTVSEGDLLILLKYFISVVPRAEQVNISYLHCISKTRISTKAVTQLVGLIIWYLILKTFLCFIQWLVQCINKSI